MQNIDSLWASDKGGLIKFMKEAPAMDLEARLNYFHTVFPYAELIPMSFYLFDENQSSLACNQETLKGMGDSSITDYVDYTIEEYMQRRNWPTWAYKKQIENNLEAIAHARTSGEEYTKDGNYIKKWITKKEAIYHDSGRFLGIIGVSMCTGLSSQLLSWDGDRRKIKIMVNEIQKVELSWREFTVLQNLLNGGTAHEIGIKERLSTKTVESYIMRIRVKFNCKKIRDVMALLIQSGLAKDILNFKARLV